MVMAAITVSEVRVVSDLVKWSNPDIYSNEMGTLAASQSVDIGTPLGVVTASGQLVVWNPTAADGSQTLVGFALRAYTTGVGGTEPLAYKARHAVVSSTGILWPAGTTAAQIAAALAEVPSIIVRAGE